jgi:hypothetical protein
VRLETALAHVTLGGVLTRTIPLILILSNAAASKAPALPSRCAAELAGRPGTAHRVLPRRHQIIDQRVRVGLRYAGQIVTIEVDDTTLRV